MKNFAFIILLLLVGYTVSFAQEEGNDIKKEENFSFFNRSELSYTFGLEETFQNDIINSFHIKTVFGYSLPKIGLGIGIENGSYRSVLSNQGTHFNTLAFSGNLHLLAKNINDRGINFFLKGAAGYAVKIGPGYSKGLTYEGAVGSMITTKKGSKYFIQAIYNFQKFDAIEFQGIQPKIKSLGAGIGAWF